MKNRNVERDENLSLRRKVFLLLGGVLSLTAGTLATSSLAWFQVGNTTFVQNILIGHNDAKFKLELTRGKDHYATPDSNYAFPDELGFVPVSSMFQSRWYNENLDPEVDSPRFLRGSFLSSTYDPNRDAAEEGDSYFDFELYFSSEQDCYVYLNEGTSISVDHNANFLIAQAQAEEHGKTPTRAELDERAYELDKAVNSARISFFSNMGYQIVDPNSVSGKEVFLAGPLDVHPRDGYFDCDHKTLKEIVYGEYDKTILDEIEYTLIEEPQSPGDGENAFEAALSEGAYCFDRESFFETFSSRIAKEPSYSLDEICFVDDRADPLKGKAHPICFIPAGKTERVVMSLYVEGWDLDCINAIAAAAFRFDITFDGFYCPEGVAGTPVRVFKK